MAVMRGDVLPDHPLQPNPHHRKQPQIGQAIAFLQGRAVALRLLPGGLQFLFNIGQRGQLFP